jgi:hypothetical protein
MYEEKEINGKVYKYDPDYDCWYRTYTKEDLNHWDKYSWLYVIAILSATILVV